MSTSGEGLFAVGSVEEAAAAIDEVARDYARHSRRAREIAEELFDAVKVLDSWTSWASIDPQGALASEATKEPRMSLLGEKCARCGKKRTRKEFAGVPTCDDCQHTLEMKLAASKESPRSCPIDRAAMQKEVVSNVIVDRCPQCKGVWLDGGELELLRGVIAGDATENLLRGVLFPPM